MNSVNIKLTPEQADAIRSGGAVLISVPRPAMTATPSDLRDAERIVRDITYLIYDNGDVDHKKFIAIIAELLAAQRETLRNAHYEDMKEMEQWSYDWDCLDECERGGRLESILRHSRERIAELTDGPTEKNL